MNNNFTHIKGFETEEELFKCLQRKFPRSSPKKAFIWFKAYNEYYAVTYIDTWSQIVISKEYFRYRYIKSYQKLTGLTKTEQIPPINVKFTPPTTNKAWNDKIVRDFTKSESPIELMHSPFKKEEKAIIRNAKILLCCLFADKTRDDDMATY